MAWQSGTLVLPFFTLYFFACLCSYASLGQDVSCWWNKGVSVNRNVSIECQADPLRSLQKCDRCQLRLIAAENSTLAVPHQCTHNTANFTAVLSPQALQDISCELLCGGTPKACTIKEGYPPPTCLIPLYDVQRNIHCRWTSLYNLLNPANFTLHWEEEEEEADETKNHGSRVMGNSDYGTIRRDKYTRSFHVRVWVSAVSALATVQSEAETFNTDNIEEPLSPLFTSHTCDPFEIFWYVEEDDYETSSQQRICEVQYKDECDLDWTEVEETFDSSFVLDHPVPFPKFRVRCGVRGERIIMSNWSLYTTRTPPRDLAIPEVLLNVTGGSQFLDVSWSVPSQFIENIQEYVVQHKPIGLPHTLCPNWDKVDRTQNSVTFGDQSWNYTAYNVSLFAVINNCSHLLQSATAYTVHEVPPKVTDVRVTDISASSAILTWEPLPLDKRVILKYLVGLSDHKDYTITVVVVTVLVCLTFLIMMIFVFIICYSSWLQGKVWLKIPDPINSSLFQQRNNQFQQSWLVPHRPSEHALMISTVDVILISDSPFDPEAELIVELPEVEQQQTRPEEDREHGEEGEKELQEPGRLDRNDSMLLQRANEYRQVIDSSEEEASRENDDDDWDELPSPSDYEKHFLPSVQDM
ncbi:interleukin 12 receptor, beta 2a, like isoform X2 [Colossoma macropomum]|uniref:interleukin 12 receptor, beta 2a, like isoform X2 n=1 Tax=Colossoma macropomum TaxID=42526 RepID=UPI001864F8AE|nr:interleukin 12 receptor, beta 2a, like isoform X2 [Colossoma macropomum]